MTSDKNGKEAREEIEGNRVFACLITYDKNGREAGEELYGN